MLRRGVGGTCRYEGHHGTRLGVVEWVHVEVVRGVVQHERSGWEGTVLHRDRLRRSVMTGGCLVELVWINDGRRSLGVWRRRRHLWGENSQTFFYLKFQNISNSIHDQTLKRERERAGGVEYKHRMDKSR